MNKEQKRDVIATLLKQGRRDLARKFKALSAMFMPTHTVKALIATNRVISDSTKLLDKSLSRFIDELEGGVDVDNKNRVIRMYEQAYKDMVAMEKAVKGLREDLAHFSAAMTGRKF